MDEPTVNGWTWTQLNNMASEVCTKCITQRSCNMYKYRLSREYRKPLTECSLIRKYLEAHPEIQKIPLSNPPCTNADPVLSPMIISMIEKGNEIASQVIAGQAREHPDTIEALYGDESNGNKTSDTSIE